MKVRTRIERDESREKARRTRYMNGWDARLVNADASANPYRREDYRFDWRRGWEACDRCELLPAWMRQTA